MRAAELLARYNKPTVVATVLWSLAGCGAPHSEAAHTALSEAPLSKCELRMRAEFHVKQSDPDLEVTPCLSDAPPIKTRKK